ncbi:hypothetical protein FG05_13882 [Fusarium graminearum]|nr:hypothetical protein FG05_13882 [Fusarium graminearum]
MPQHDRFPLSAEGTDGEMLTLIRELLLRQSPAETTGTPKSSYELWHYTLFCEIEAGKAKVARLLVPSGQSLIDRLASMAKEEEKDNG